MAAAAANPIPGSARPHHTSISGSTGATAAGGPKVGSIHGHYSFMTHDSMSAKSAAYPGSQQAAASVDSTAAFISSVVHRLVQRLPFNSGMKMTVLEDDALIRSCVATLVTISQYQLPAVIKELITAMESLNKVSPCMTLTTLPLSFHSFS